MIKPVFKVQTLVRPCVTNSLAFDLNQSAVGTMQAADFMMLSTSLNIWHKMDVTDRRFSLILEIQREIEAGIPAGREKSTKRQEG
jgi:hypothetical protein